MNVLAFGPFELDPPRRRLSRDGQPVVVSDRHLDVLLLLVARAGQVVAKDDLLQAGWRDIAVGDNSIEQAISALRRTLSAASGGAPYIETVPRRGYRFAAPVERRTTRESDAALDALLAPHRAFIEGQAALETLEGDQVARALDVFEGALNAVPEYAAAHVGLANACVMRFEMTRADRSPDLTALDRAARHAREACRLDPQSAEAWATLGFVLGRTHTTARPDSAPGTGGTNDALAASKRAIVLEPDNWRHHFRLAYVGWGDERLRAAHRTLKLLPGFPLAHWLAATVYVARQVFDDAERELAGGIAAFDAARVTGASRFGAVALHWLRGLLHLARGDESAALAAFERELARELDGHLYARECCANTWYAVGALRLRQHRPDEAAAAFERTLDRIPTHPLARVAMNEVRPGSNPGRAPSIDRLTFEGALAKAAGLALAGDHPGAAQVVDTALAAAPPGNAGWLIPLEPLLVPHTRPEIWAGTLARLRVRAA